MFDQFRLQQLCSFINKVELVEKTSNWTFCNMWWRKESRRSDALVLTALPWHCLEVFLTEMKPENEVDNYANIFIYFSFSIYAIRPNGHTLVKKLVHFCAERSEYVDKPCQQMKSTICTPVCRLSFQLFFCLNCLLRTANKIEIYHR